MFEYLATIGIVPIVIAWLASIWLLNRTLHKAHSIRPKNEEERKRDEKYSMFKQLDVMKKSVASTFNFADKYCDYFEKYKNLLLWHD